MEPSNIGTSGAHAGDGPKRAEALQIRRYRNNVTWTIGADDPDY